MRARAIVANKECINLYNNNKHSTYNPSPHIHMTHKYYIYVKLHLFKKVTLLYKK